MKLACNYYKEVEELINEKKISIDYFKFPSLGYQCDIFADGTLSEYSFWVARTNEICPVMIHGLGPTFDQIGSINFQQWMDVNIAKKVIGESGVNGLSLHLSGIDTTLSNKENENIILDNIKYLKEIFNNVEFMSFENVDGNPYLNKDKFGICINPDFISEIIHKADVDFLLDISHAYCSARCLNMDFYDYIEKLPLDKLYEIHINGWHDVGTDIMAHTKITDESYMALQNILYNHKAEIVTLEYGRSDDRLGLGIPLLSPTSSNNEAKFDIIEQIEKLRQIISVK